MVKPLTRAIWEAQIQEWIWGPRQAEDHVRIYNMVGAAEARLAADDPTLSALRYYRDLAEDALIEGGPGCLPIWGGPTVYDPLRDTTPEEREEKARSLHACFQAIFHNNHLAQE
jgi:hypothetical protein